MKKVIIICGPTACGKTEVAIALANIIDGEIISADSKQIYRGMDIGTAKPTKAQQAKAPHHLIDVADPGEDFSAAIFQAKACDAIEDIYARGKTPIIAGGTGFYINAAVYKNALDRGPEEPLKSDCDAKFIILTRDRAKLYEAIDRRVDDMINSGLEDEVKRLLAEGLKEDTLAIQALGYKEMLPYIHGHCSLEAAKKNIAKGSRRYAKRQLTWFRHQVSGFWLKMDEKTPEDAAMEIKNLYS